jgi:LSD1 subclass zinc finger protein
VTSPPDPERIKCHPYLDGWMWKKKMICVACTTLFEVHRGETRVFCAAERKEWVPPGGSCARPCVVT